MNLYEHQRSRSFIDLGPRSLGFNIFSTTSFPKETAGLIESKLHVDWGNESDYSSTTKFVQMVLG